MCAIELQRVKNGTIVPNTPNFETMDKTVMKIQPIIRIDVDEKETITRMETGVVQDLGDWPGIFIRGDDAVRMAHTIETVLEDSVYKETLFTTMLSSYANLLKSCVVDDEVST